MKTGIAVLTVVIALALAAALVNQSNRARKQQSRIESLQVEVEKLAQEARASEAEIKELQKERSNLRSDLITAEREASKAARTAQAAPATLTTSPPEMREPETGGSSGSGNLRNMFGNMLKNPEMRKAMEEQQRLGLNMMYGSLFKRLELTPEQEQKFKDILLDQQMSNMSQAGEMFDASNRAEAMQKLAAKQKERDQQLKDLMGEEKFAQYQDYNQTVGERMMLEQFGKDVEMTPEQKDQLLEILKEEKKNIQLSAGVDNNSDPNKANMEAVMSSPEAAEKLMAVQEQVNARLMERAPEILSAEQVRKLEPVMKSQLEFQRAGMKMARQMFGGEGAGEAAPPAVESVK